MKRYKLLLFDLDDTLLYSDWYKKGLVQTIGEHTLTKNLDAALFLKKKLHVPSHLIEKLKNREFTPEEFRRARWQHAFSHFDMTPDDEIINEIEALFLQTGFSCIKQDASLIQLLKDLGTHYKLGIVTNALYDPRQKVYKMGLSKVFPNDTIFCAEELGLRKPDRELYHAPLKYFGIKPEETVFIGDSWVHDVAGAIDSGMAAIWINTRGAVPTTGHSPYAVVSDVKDIRKLLLDFK
jgi:5'-nucleotidase